MLPIIPRLWPHVTAILATVRLVGQWGPLAGLLTMVLMIPHRSACYAGGGPENVFLLVNPTSQNSLTVANHYIALRKIPATNVFYLPFKGSKTEISGKVFRKLILLPAFAEIERRKLANQIDYLVYSCDFPWRVFFASDFPDEKFPPQFVPRGSLTGLTFLSSFVKEKRKEIVSLNTNWYYMEPLGGITISRAFRSQYRWASGGRRTGAQGITYMISSMLGIMEERGNEVSEIVSSLRLAKEADGTNPAGTVYFMKHGGPRSSPRHEYFDAAATELRRSGVAAKVLDSKFPDKTTGIAGLTCGVPYKNLAQSGCRFLPGAFCDNLTSFGAVLTNYKPLINKKTGKKTVFQLSVADFIRHGATAASGAVFEPYAIRQKFPLPTLHVHYANGCSMGESFYQAVSGPYQQLLVGDPLCQPWADIPEVHATEITPGALLRGLVKITPTSTPKNSEKKGAPIKQFELYVDGTRNQHCKPGESFSFDTTSLPDGHHELCVVAIDDTPIETQGRLITEVTIKNGIHAVSLTSKTKKLSSRAKYVSVQVTSTDSTSVDVYCNSQKLGSIPSGSGKLRILTEKLGAGPVKLHAVSSSTRSRPLQLDIAG